MIKGYRRTVFVVLGTLTAILLYACFYNASEQQSANYHYQPARHQSRVIVLPGKTYPKGYQPNCDNPQSDKDADLCAQWAAVDQVMEANRLASVNVKLALLISVLTFIGTGFVGWTFLEGRTTSRRELRAYLFVEAIGLGAATSGPTKGHPGGVIKVKNFGQTPAYRVLHYGVIDLVNSQNPALTPIPEKLEDISATAIPSGSGITAIRAIGRAMTRLELKNLRAGTMVLVARGRVEYIDTFGANRWSSYHYYYSGQWPPAPDMVMHIANDGNESDQDHQRFQTR